MTQAYRLKVYTPTGLLLEETVAKVKLNTPTGEISVLPAHCKYTGVLAKGVMEAQIDSSTEVRKVTISGGFCNFDEDCLTVLADSAEMVANS